MADYIYFADQADGTTLSSRRCHYDQGERKLPRFWVEETGWVRATRVVIRKRSPSNHKCDVRCLNATGRTMQCECSCGGKNHGKGKIVCE